MNYEIIFESAAERDIKILQPEMVRRVDSAIVALSATPRPAGSLKLKGFDDSVYRIRVGDYRILYIIEDENRIIRIIRIRRRPKAYK